ncbi:fibrinogen C domain-containing protein 1-like [Zophobas morio]|uniref:fibrinogen C domain-containing protein 1-like n=1 Tax=Zophobas morio TaxID=2755281 RepID=UPI003083528B
MATDVLGLRPFVILGVILVGLASAPRPVLSTVSTTEHPYEDHRPAWFFNLTKRLGNLESQNAQILTTLNTVTQKLAQHPSNCLEVQQRGHNASGVYNIQPKFSPKPFPVYCNMETHGGGWTYFIHRNSGQLDFYLKWNDYKIGFGDLRGEHWLGLEHLHHLTASDDNEILVEMADWDGVSAYALYDAFFVGSEETGYALKALGVYSGDAGDSMGGYAGMKFTTQDKDQDTRVKSNCAVDEYGAWWYIACSGSNPTSRYLKQARQAPYMYNIMYWYSFRGADYSLKMMRMMVRPRRT